tara:strand:- start:3092 stop:4057 length:966 start_codon:yes stop_codon:yes gene_type:complete
MAIKNNILVTGCSGFIGMHLCHNLLVDGYNVLGIDNMNKYYDLKLKEDRLKKLCLFDNFIFQKVDISDWHSIDATFNMFKPRKVINLAAQAGVRYSLKNPQAYIQSNINGFMNILEACRLFEVDSLIYASSSSVYGGNKLIPFSVEHRVDGPISIYAATKRSNELMAYTYNHLYGLKTTGLRFFTVYGPWGRPDMAMYIFTEKIINNKEISVFNNGNMERDFTYIDDIIKGVRSSMRKNYECEIFNLGNNHSENLMDMIAVIENYLGKKAKVKFMEIQPGDVEKTSANIDHSKKKLNYEPSVTINEGIPKFIDWFNSYSKH